MKLFVQEVKTLKRNAFVLAVFVCWKNHSITPFTTLSIHEVEDQVGHWVTEIFLFDAILLIYNYRYKRIIIPTEDSFSLIANAYILNSKD